jgi:hypothetical protein
VFSAQSDTQQVSFLDRPEELDVDEGESSAVDGCGGNAI